VINENLGFVFQATKGGGMNDAIAVALKIVARVGGRFRHMPTQGCFRVGGVRGKIH
jgi:hypothetical protein